MEVLSLLEQKVARLLTLISGLRFENECLKNENNGFKQTIEQLEGQKAQLTEELANLHQKLEEFAGISSENDKSIDTLTQEREKALLALDDLIKNIDVFVESENHQ